MFFRTDLALELKEGGQSELLDVPCKIKEKDRCKISHITVPCHIKDTGMAPGEYITIEMPPLSDALDENNRFLQVVSDEIKPFLPENGEVLVAGLGNAAITPDALGEKVIAQILATRHVKKELERITGISELRSVAAVSTDVLGNTGMETAEILKGIVDNVKPKLVIVIDSLASRSMERISSTIQLADTGIVPGAGVDNARKELTVNTLGVPVIALGIPTVVETAVVVNDCLDVFIEKLQEKAESNEYLNKLKEEDNYLEIKEALIPKDFNFIVTPKEIDSLVENMKDVVARGINMSL